MDNNIAILTVFIICFIIINFPKIPFIRIDRTSGVTIGSVLLIVLGAITLNECYQMIDWNVITFLLGMMIMIAFLEIANFFDFTAYKLVSFSHNTSQLLLYTLLSSALLSAFFVNDTICLLLTPIIIKACKNLKLNPIPFLIAIATGSNIGSALTITGNPQNMYIGIQSDLNFLNFSKMMILPCVFALSICFIFLKLVFKKELKKTFLKNAEIKNPGLKTLLTYKTLFALLITLVLFIIGMSYPVSAMIGAAIIMLIAYVPPRHVFKKVDWTLLLFFAGLFILMGVFQKAGFMQKLVSVASPYMAGDDIKTYLGFSALTTILSNLISNVPAVILMKPFIQHMGATPALWTLLAMVSTFAGNFILVGSVANLIVAEKASNEGIELDFVSYMKVGIPVSVISIAAGSLFLFFTK